MDRKEHSGTVFYRISQSSFLKKIVFFLKIFFKVQFGFFVVKKLSKINIKIITEEIVSKKKIGPVDGSLNILIGDLERLEYPFIAITPRSILNQSGCTS